MHEPCQASNGIIEIPVFLQVYVTAVVDAQGLKGPPRCCCGCHLKHNFAVRQGYALFRSTGCRRCWLEHPGLILSRRAPFACYPAPNTLTNIINSGGRLIETMVRASNQQAFARSDLRTRHFWATSVAVVHVLFDVADTSPQ